MPQEDSLATEVLPDTAAQDHPSAANEPRRGQRKRQPSQRRRDMEPHTRQRLFPEDASHTPRKQSASNSSDFYTLPADCHDYTTASRHPDSVMAPEESPLLPANCLTMQDAQAHPNQATNASQIAAKRQSTRPPAKRQGTKRQRRALTISQYTSPRQDESVHPLHINGASPLPSQRNKSRKRRGPPDSDPSWPPKQRPRLQSTPTTRTLQNSPDDSSNVPPLGPGQASGTPFDRGP